MMASPLVLLTLATGMVVSGEVSGGDPPVSRPPSLSDRLAELQRVVEQQDSLLRQQGQQLETALAAMSPLHQKLADQEQKLAEQEQKLADQEQKLAQQDRRMAEQEALVGGLNHNLAVQDLKLSDQEALVGQLNLKLAVDLAATLRTHTAHSSDGHATDQSSPVLPTLGSGTQRPPSPHDVLPRADDAGPLEGVVAALSQQVTEMSADLQALEHSDQQQTHDIRAASSSVFVRWGAAACDNSSQLVYSGVVGGSQQGHSGAATNYLCLTLSPVMSSHAVPGYLALLYGGEYQTYDSHIEHSPVCAVCRSSFPTTLMVPGTNVCSPGWRLLYSGYLMAGYYSHAAGSEFVCVDPSFQDTIGNSANEDAKLMYFSATRCGSLPCPPYENNKVVTCAVCAQ